MSSRVIARGTWLRGPYATADGAITSQLRPPGRGSSIPSHISFVEPFRPECPICAPIAHPPCAWANVTIRFHASTWSGRYMPAHPGVILPMSDTQIISVMTNPAPPSARAPRCTRWKSPGVPSTAEYMSIGDTTTRFRNSNPRNRSGVNIGGRGSGCTALTNPGSRSRRFSYVTRRDRVSRLNAN